MLAVKTDAADLGSHMVVHTDGGTKFDPKQSVASPGYPFFCAVCADSRDVFRILRRAHSPVYFRVRGSSWAFWITLNKVESLGIRG